MPEACAYTCGLVPAARVAQLLALLSRYLQGVVPVMVLAFGSGSNFVKPWA